MRKIIIILFFINILFNSCVYDRRSCIRVKSSSEQNIYVCISCKDSMEIERNLTYMQQREDNKIMYPSYRIGIDSTGCVPIGWSKESTIRKCEDKKLRYFFIVDTVMRDNTWKEVCEKQLYEKKMVFTEEELIQMDWTVVYQ